MPRRLLLPLLVALPALAVAAAGTTHPVFLTPETAERWRAAHLVLLPLFPLLGGAVWFVLRGERGPAAQGARVLAFLYAVGYTALDSIAGVGASHQVLRAAEAGEPGPRLQDVYEIGDRLGHLGVYALAAAGLLAGLVLYLRTRSPLAVVGGAVVAAACWPFKVHHVFPPRGVLAVVAIGVGLALLEASRQRVSSAKSSPGP